MAAGTTFGALFLEALVVSVAAPMMVEWRRSRALAMLAGLGIPGLGASWVVASGQVGFLALLCSQLLLLAFGTLLLGLARWLFHPGSRGRPLLASLVGIAMLVSPFLGNPFLEDPRGRARPLVRDVILEVNPMAGIASPRILDVDWLRHRQMYKAVTLGQYHAYQYPHPARQGLVFFFVGALLILLCRVEME
jgi:hypothetical protein